MRFISVIVLFLSLISCKSTVKNESKEKALPNVILIMVDDQGYADFEAFANHDSRISTPGMNRIAAMGTSYTQAYTSAPVCSPSRVGLLTGKNQFRWDKPASWGPGLPETVKTMPEYLKEVGYMTAKVGKSDLGRNFHKNDVREYPLNHGFDEFLGFSAHAHDYWLLSDEIKSRTPDPHGTSALLGPLMHNMEEKSYDEGYITDIFTDEAIDFIQRDKDKPFYLNLSYSAVHHLIHEVPQPYLDEFEVEAIPNYDPKNMLEFGKHPAGSYSAYYDKYSRMGDIQDKDMRNFYLANLKNLDDNIGRFLDAVEGENLLDNTIIIYMSDNGGSPLNGSHNAPLTAGKYSLWEGGIRVPMCVVWPGKLKAGVIDETPVSALDIFPTIMQAANIIVDDATVDGIPFTQTSGERLFVWKWQKTWAARQGDWKITNSNENHWKSRPYEAYIKPILDDNSIKLFNLKNDPGERNNLAESNPDKVEELTTAYENWLAENVDRY